MRYVPIQKMQVDVDLQGKRRVLGTLVWSGRERQAYFEYAPEFIAAPMPMSPFRLPVRAGMAPPYQAHRDLGGLHGLFNDSVPDGWGRLLLDNRLRKMGVRPAGVAPLDRLSAVGTTGMGALAFIPELPQQGHEANDLDWFVEHVDRVQAEMDTADIDALQEAQGGSAGARPKIMVGLNAERNTLFIDYGLGMKPGFEHWLVKGLSLRDRDDMGIEEHAYALMAGAAGLDMAETCVLTTTKGNRLFATKRFDRTPDGRLHMHTASGLANTTHQEPSLDYTELHKITGLLTRDSREVARMFRNMTFNVFAHNRDDHAKNHAFLMDANGHWTVSPAYDLTFSSGPAGEHSAAIAGEGREPGKSHLLAVAKGASIAARAAADIIEEVRSAVNEWPYFADEAGLGHARTLEIDRVLNGARGHAG